MADLNPTPRELALHAARLILGKGGEDVVVLELPDEHRSLYDYVVIGNGRSDRQAHTLVNEAYHFCKRHKVPHFPVEGESGWYVVDCHDVVVHSFVEDQREHYQLEALWPGCTQVDFETELEALPDPDLQDA